MNLDKFNEFYLNDLLDKLSKESTTVFFLGDFDKNFQHYKTHQKMLFLIPHLFIHFSPKCFHQQE